MDVSLSFYTIISYRIFKETNYFIHLFKLRFAIHILIKINIAILIFRTIINQELVLFSLSRKIHLDGSIFQRAIKNISDKCSSRIIVLWITVRSLCISKFSGGNNRRMKETRLQPFLLDTISSRRGSLTKEGGRGAGRWRSWRRIVVRCASGNTSIRSIPFTFTDFRRIQFLRRP